MTSIPWQQRLGNQRDWIWRGWQTRYTCVRSAGSSSTPLLLLHGFGGSIGHWRHNLPELGQHHTVYALDLLGFGASEKVTASFGVELWVEQVYDFWRLFVKQPVILVGNSIGSLVALAAAATHPEMVSGIVMLNLPDASVLEVPLRIKQAIALLNPLSRPALALTKWVATSPLIFDGLFWLVRHPQAIRLFWARQAYAGKAAVTDELVDIFSTPAYDRNAVKALRAMVRSTAQPSRDYAAKVVLPTLTIPMLLFWGLKDTMVPPQLAKLFVKYNPNLKLVEIEDAGHCPHDECPEIVNQEILNWINSWTEGQRNEF
ncbi:alpha/beta fold hydrolase [Phormidium sp. CLA17]|nr:alpha/beta fold hydrolase [Leptolyngbya sp. Cla-17]